MLNSHAQRLFSAHVLSLLVEYLPDKTELCQVIEQCFRDYTRNNNGDIGSKLRIAAMKSIQRIDKDLERIPDELYGTLVNNVIQQGAEKILAVRTEAAYALLTFFRNKNSSIPDLVRLENLLLPKTNRKDYLEKDPKSSANSWGDRKVTSWAADWGKERYFNKYKDVLNIQTFQKSSLRGLLVSSGDMTESLSAAASAALYEFIDKIEDETVLEGFVENIYKIWIDDSRNLVTKPLLKVLDEFLSKSLSILNVTLD